MSQPKNAGGEQGAITGISELTAQLTGDFQRMAYAQIGRAFGLTGDPLDQFVANADSMFSVDKVKANFHALEDAIFTSAMDGARNVTARVFRP